MPPNRIRAVVLAACAGTVLLCVVKTDWAAADLVGDFRFAWMGQAMLFFAHAALVVAGSRRVQMGLAAATAVYSLLLVGVLELDPAEVVLFPMVFIAIAGASIFATPAPSPSPGRTRKVVVLAILAAVWAVLTLGGVALAYALAELRIVPDDVMQLVPLLGLAGLGITAWRVLRRGRPSPRAE
jgi:hypothetical protein